MRQAPIVSGRLQISGRPLPEWFSKSVGQANSSTIIRNTRANPPLPPLPAEPPPNDDEEEIEAEDEFIEESEYEEIDHIPKYSNANENGGLRKSGVKWICSLCGNYNPAVKCEMCNNQVFCAACNEMFHRHPKRHNHIRKLLQVVQTRPPLPPKAAHQPQQQHTVQQHHQQQRVPQIPLHMRSSSPFGYPQNGEQQSFLPVPPPRRNRKFGSTSNLRSSANNSPTLTRKFSFDPMGSLKRFVKGSSNKEHQLPLLKSTPKKISSSTSNIQKAMNSHPTIWRNSNNSNNSFNSSNNRISPHFNSIEFNNHRSAIPLSVYEISNRNNNRDFRNNTVNSRSFVNLSNSSSQDSGYRGDEDEFEFNNNISNNMIFDDYTKQRSNSHGFLHRISTSNPSTHFATLQRQPKNNVSNASTTVKQPLRPPPPIPPRDFSGMAQFQQYPAGYPMPAAAAAYPQQQMFQSAFELNRSDGAFVPWNRLSYDEWQQAQLGYPQQQSTSIQSMSMSPQPNWKPTSFGPPLSQAEMEQQIFETRQQQNKHLSPMQQGQIYKNEPREQKKKSNISVNNIRPKSAAATRAITPHELKHEPKEEPRYYSGDFDPNGKNNEDEIDEIPPTQKIIVSENPEGPWSCEHCTFVNAKSTRICTICCKTPLEGYRTIVTETLTMKKEEKPASSIAKPENSTSTKPKVDIAQKDLTKSKTIVTAKNGPVRKQIIKTPPPPVAQSYSSSESESDVESDDESSDGEEIIQPRQKYSPKRQQQLEKQPTQRPQNNTANSQVVKKNKNTSVGSSPPPNARNFADDFGIDELSISDDEFEEVSPARTSTAKRNTPNIKSSMQQQMQPSKRMEDTTSKGTSPPPQTTSTQTYEEFPTPKPRSKAMSLSKSSLHQSSDSSRFISSSSRDVSSPSPPPKVELSAKALRYARRAQQKSRLKRSASAHLTSTNNDSDPWVMDSHHHHPNYYERYHRHHQSQHYPQGISDYEGRHFHRSASRHSLASDTRSLPISGPPSRDSSPSAVARGKFFKNFRNGYPVSPNNKHPSWDRFPSPGDYFASIEDLVTRKNRESMKSQEFELSRLLKDAEELNYTPEDVQVALRMCGERNPIKWLQENWSNMIETVQTLATKYGHEKGEMNDVGTISTGEAKEALRQHRGNVWAGVTECVEQRRKKFHELQTRGTFLREDILTALTAHHGHLDTAYIELSKAQLKPFLMRIWGPPTALNDNEATAPRSESILSLDSSLSGKQHKGIPNVNSNSYQELQNQQSQPSVQLRQEEMVQQNGKVLVLPDQQPISQTTNIQMVQGCSTNFQPSKQGKFNQTPEYTSSSLQGTIPTNNNMSQTTTTANDIINQTTTTRTRDGLQEHVKYDPEDENFMDAISDYNNLQAASAENVKIAANRRESVKSNESFCSTSEPEILDEAIISHFIQNFLIPAAAAPASIDLGQQSQTQVIDANNIAEMNEEVPGKLIKDPSESISPFAPIITGTTAAATTNSASITPSSLSTTRTSSELEKLFNDPHQGMISPQHQLANLAKAMNLISEKLGVLLEKQEKTALVQENLVQNDSNSNNNNNNSNKMGNKTEDETIQTQFEHQQTQLGAEQRHPQSSVAGEVLNSKHVITLTNKQGNNEANTLQEKKKVMPFSAPERFSDTINKTEHTIEATNTMDPSASAAAVANVNDHEILMLKEIYKNELKLLRDLILNEAKSKSSDHCVLIANASEAGPSNNISSKNSNSMIELFLKQCQPKLYEALGKKASSFLQTSQYNESTDELPSARKHEAFCRENELLNENILSSATSSVDAKIIESDVINPTNINTAKDKDGDGNPAELNIQHSSLINSKNDNQNEVPSSKNDENMSIKQEQEQEQQDLDSDKYANNNMDMDSHGTGTIGIPMTLYNHQDESTNVAAGLYEIKFENGVDDNDEDITDEENEDVEEAELDFEGESGSESPSNNSFNLIENEEEDEEEEDIEQEQNELKEPFNNIEETDEEGGEGEYDEEVAEIDEMDHNVADQYDDDDDNVYEEIEVHHPQIELPPTAKSIQKQGHKSKNKTTKKVKATSEGHHVKSLSPVKEIPLEQIVATTAIIKSVEIPSSSTSENKKRTEQKQVRQLISKGKVRTVAQGELALKLIEMNFTEDDSTAAATECSSLYTALCFLQQECFLCAGKFCAREMISMLQCIHRCCRTCATEYFMLQIRDHPVIDLTCPFCKEPSDLNDDPELATNDYFSQLDVLLKDLLSERYYEMFQRKLRDWALSKMPNFKWCSKCSSGFIMEPMQTRLICPECSTVTCAICMEQWDKDNHDHKELRKGSIALCDEEDQSSNSQALKSVVDFLNENCIDCPRCHLKFTLARGGCMHLTCSQCRFEFCSGCSSQFRMGSKCSENAFCQKLGLHAHHPRNCLFYLRDKEPQMLIQLLEENNILYQKEDQVENFASEIASGEVEEGKILIREKKARHKCQVPIQKETEDGTQDDTCGQETCPGHTTVCLVHYVEYLGLLVWQNHLDPISLLSNDDLETIIKRAHKKLPRRPYGTKDVDYRPLLLKVIEEEIPL